MRLDPALGRRLFAKACGERWRVSPDRFVEALAASADRAFAGGQGGLKPAPPSDVASDAPSDAPSDVPSDVPSDPPSGVPSAVRTDAVERYLCGLHLEDLALACACAAGDEAAWEHFVRVHRPALYCAADAIDPSGGARDLADSLYGDLFGTTERDGERRSLFRYFHGRSSLSTWLRAVLSQRFVDRVRSRRRENPLPDDESAAALSAPDRPIDPDRDRHAALLRSALAAAIAAIAPRDRLRLKSYYAQALKLAAIGRLLGEHEATVSRHLARTRAEIRDAVEQALRRDHGMDDAAVAECLAAAVQDPGAMDIRELVGTSPERKNDARDRSS